MFFKRRAGARWYDRGNIVSLDYTKDVLTADGNWHDLDISGIIGIGEKLVLIQGYLKENAGGNGMKMRTKGYTNEINVAECKTQVADKICDHSYWLNTNLLGIIQYNIDIATWANIDLAIRGFFKS